MTQDKENQENQESSNEPVVDKSPQGSDQESVPLAKFLEVKGTLKEMKDKLNSFEEKEKELQESKLLEEKNYQELLAKRDDELKNFKSQLEQERLSFKVNSVKDKFARVLDKNDAVNSDDILRLVDIQPILEAENQDDLIKKTVEDLKENKSYLFKMTVPNHSENKKITNNPNKQLNPNAKKDSALSIWLN